MLVRTWHVFNKSHNVSKYLHILNVNCNIQVRRCLNTDVVKLAKKKDETSKKVSSTDKSKKGAKGDDKEPKKNKNEEEEECEEDEKGAQKKQVKAEPKKKEEQKDRIKVFNIYRYNPHKPDVKPGMKSYKVNLNK